MRWIVLNLCVAMRASCSFAARPIQQGQSSVRYDGVQEAARMAASAPAPLGGRIEEGRLAVAGAARVDTASSAVAAEAAPVMATSGAAHRAPWFSGEAMLGYGITANAEAHFSCAAAAASGAVRWHPALEARGTQSTTLWRCLMGLRLSYAARPTVRLTAGASFGAESASVVRRVDETLTLQQFTGSALQSQTQTRTVYDERFGRAFAIGWLTIGALFEPRAWLRFELGAALGLLPVYLRTASQSSSVVVPGQAPLSRADNFDGASIGAHGQGWIGAALGPAWARFALRASVGGGDVEGVAFGAQAAMVFAPQVYAPQTDRAQSAASPR